MKYHLIWCPRYRRKVLTGKIATGLEEILQDAARDNELTIHALEIMPDHIYLFPGHQLVLPLPSKDVTADCSAESSKNSQQDFQHSGADLTIAGLQDMFLKKL